MPRFSVIVPHFQGTIPHEILCRGIDSLKGQTFGDFEILLYHDGPLTEPQAKMPHPIKATERRFNDWGHSLRDIGIREASGDYIIHFNPDNILYPGALEEIDRELQRPPRIINTNTGLAMDTDHIVVFPIIMRGMQKIYDFLVRDRDHPEWFIILTGNPPRPSQIDAMQLVMKRTLWLAEGGWYDRSRDGDGQMYTKFALKYGYRAVGPVLGEHY
jgi:hypothetical protein